MYRFVKLLTRDMAAVCGGESMLCLCKSNADFSPVALDRRVEVMVGTDRGICNRYVEQVRRCTSRARGEGGKVMVIS